MVTKKKVRKKVASATLTPGTVNDSVEGQATDPVDTLTMLANDIIMTPLGAMEDRFKPRLCKVADVLNKVTVALVAAQAVAEKLAAKKQAQIDKYAARIAKLNTN